MKILTTFESLAAITASGATSGYPVANVIDLDPGLIWKADAFTGDVWLKINFGSSKILTAVFFNRANFAQCRIQGHASDAWETPSYNSLSNLGTDEAGNRKGWFDLTSFEYQWLRILIPLGTSLDSGTVPSLGNLIVGSSLALPRCASLSPDLIGRVDRFESDGGNVSPYFRGIQRYVLNLSFGDYLSVTRGMPKTWEHAVITDDLGDVAGAWLIFRPDRFAGGIKSRREAELRSQFEERT